MGRLKLPRDWMGQELKVGDKVLIPAIVTDTRSGHYFEIDLQVKLVKVLNNKITFLAMHSSQVEKQ